MPVQRSLAPLMGQSPSNFDNALSSQPRLPPLSGVNPPRTTPSRASPIAVCTLGEECRDPQRDMPVGIIGSLVVVSALYVLVTLVVTGMVPVPLLDPSAPLATAFSQVTAICHVGTSRKLWKGARRVPVCCHGRRGGLAAGSWSPGQGMGQLVPWSARQLELTAVRVCPCTLVSQLCPSCRSGCTGRHSSWPLAPSPSSLRLLSAPCSGSQGFSSQCLGVLLPHRWRPLHRLQCSRREACLPGPLEPINAAAVRIPKHAHMWMQPERISYANRWVQLCTLPQSRMYVVSIPLGCS